MSTLENIRQNIRDLVFKKYGSSLSSKEELVSLLTEFCRDKIISLTITKRYEYMIQDAPCTSIDHIREWLNSLGDDGWQVVDVKRHRTSYRNSESAKPPTFYFMREKR